MIGGFFQFFVCLEFGDEISLWGGLMFWVFGELGCLIENKDDS